MSKMFLGLSIVAISYAGTLKAADAQPAPVTPANTTVAAQSTEAKYKSENKANEKSTDGEHGFFHPLCKFWVHTVGGRMSDGMKSGASTIHNGIAGGGDKDEKSTPAKK